jgi:hypothetical protein
VENLTKMKTLFLLLFMLMLGAACRHAPPGETGGSSFVMVEPHPASPPAGSSAEPVERASQVDFREAQARHPLVMPVYPPRALKAKAGAAQVGVRVTVDVNGAVKDVRPSMLAISITPPKFADEFREAVEVAVRQWKFHPARLRTFEVVSEGGVTYNRVTSNEAVEAEFDLAFNFTTAGKVEAGTAGD